MRFQSKNSAVFGLFWDCFGTVLCPTTCQSQGATDPGYRGQYRDHTGVPTAEIRIVYSAVQPAVQRIQIGDFCTRVILQVPGCEGNPSRLDPG